MGFGYYGSTEVFDVVFTVAFIGILIAIVVVIVRGIATWNKNNHSPRLSVKATVVTKRESVSVSNEPMAGDATGAHGFMTSSHTTYYATFQVESGDRMEFNVSDKEFRMMAEGDTGTLSFQGTRFLSFERDQ